MKDSIRFFSGLSVFFLFSLSLNAQTYTESSLESLKKIVDINSGSVNSDGVNQVQNWVAERLKKQGFQVELFSNPSSERKIGQLVVGTLAGKSPKFITFLVHVDTVFDPSSPFQKFTLSTDGKTAYGPGIIDDKAGVVIALDALEAYLSAGTIPDYSLRFVSSPREEVGSSNFLSRFRDYGKNSELLLGFEPTLEEGAIIQGRRGNRWYTVRVSGREAHAGRSHSEGVNACVELADKLVKISRLTDYATETTVSVGHMEGGQDKFNIVCGLAEAKIDTRFTKMKNLDRLHRKIEKILKDHTVRSRSTGEEAITTYRLKDDCPPFSAESYSRPYIDKYLKIVSKIERRTIQAKNSGGSADSNYFNRPGLVVMDGLGAVGGGMHTQEEFLVVSSLETRKRALVEFLKALKISRKQQRQ